MLLKTLGCTTLDDNNFVSILKRNKLILNEDVENILIEYIKKEVKNEKVVFYCQLAHTFEITELAKITIAYIHRFFTMIAESPEFLELSFYLVSKILSSSQLEITSEMEVSNAINFWINHCLKQRNKYALCLLKKVRLPLLSDYALKHILVKSSSFSKSSDCVEFLEGALDNKDLSLKDKSSTSYQRRYCEQKDFNFLVLGGKVWYGKRSFVGDKSVRLINGSNYTKIIDLCPNIESRKHSKAVFVKGEIFLFGGQTLDREFIQTVEKYSIKFDKWQSIAELNENHSNYGVCSFLDKVYLIGGAKWDITDNESESTNNEVYYDSDYSYNSYHSDSTASKKVFYATNSCLEFNTKSYKFKDVSSMNFVRCFGHSSTVFEEKIVVAGGITDDDYDGDSVTNSVESYNVFADKWSLMPCLIKKSDVRLIACKSKLFAFKWSAKNQCEVFDKTSNNMLR